MPKKDDRPSSTPTSFPETTPPLPSGDYSYVLEIVMRMQESVGKLIEAVGTLKEQAKETSGKLDQVRMDMHAAKSAGKTLLWVVGVVGALLGIFLAAYFRQILGVPPAH